MSGWIKLEKDLLTDPRLLRLAQWLRTSIEMSTTKIAGDGWAVCNGSPLPGVTLVLGALAHLWMIADTHIGEDDVLPLGTDEIDELLGLPGFTELLPQDWLQVISEDSVKLPGYHEHNGTVAKERALNQKRVAKSRDKVKRSTVTPRNGKALPDQDPYQDHIRETPQPPFVIPPAIGREAWDEWITFRRKRRFPVDPQTLGQHVKLLLRYSQTIQREIIDSSIGSNWQGLFAPKGQRAPKPDLLKDWQPPAEPAT